MKQTEETADIIEGDVETEQERIARLKREYLEYYRELPVQKLATRLSAGEAKIKSLRNKSNRREPLGH